MKENVNVDIFFLEKLDVLHSDVSTSSNIVRNAFDEKNVIICANNMKYSANTKDYFNERCRGNIDPIKNIKKKCSLTKYHSEIDKLYDERTALERVDYSQPERAHRANNTIIYATPTMGWET